jgi:hypothetical protein
MSFRGFRNSDSTLKTALLEAAQWAESGQAWTLAVNSSLVVSTTLDADIAAAATSIPVASATGIVSGSRYVIESAEEVAVVHASNTATDPVTIAVSVNTAFASGSRFRYYDFLPMIGVITVIERPPLFYDVEISGMVDRRNL